MKHSLPVSVAIAIFLFASQANAQTPWKAISSTNKAIKTGTQIGKNLGTIVPSVQSNVLRAVQQAKFALPDPTHKCF